VKRLYLLTKKPFAPTTKRLQEALSERLGYRVVRRKTPNPRRVAFEYLNGPGLNKIRQMELFSANGVQCPLWTTRREVAATWEGLVCARTLTNSSKGRGLIIAESTELPYAPLYTLYIKKKYEFRVQVFEGQVLRSVIKLKKRGVERNTTLVRNTDNGYIFANIPGDMDEDLMELVEDLAKRAVAAVGYRYGAVDIIYNRHHNEAYVLEVNSAPAMEGSTLKVYTEAIVESQ